MPKVQVLGADCFSGDVAAATEAVVGRAREGAGGYACLCNVHLLTLARREQKVWEALDGAWCTFADGAPVAWLQRRLGAPDSRRVAGTDLMRAVVDKGREAELGHFLFGGHTETLQRLRERLEADYPGVRVAGAIAPPFGTHDQLQDEFVDAVAGTRPHIIWCGLGAPKQELWMSAVERRLPGSLLVGVGAAFDFIAGTKRRAPTVMQGLGLEWLHRLLHEPRRLGWRYASTNTQLLLALLRHGWRAQ
jgi:N-acetylglucosaminyldiphosphoundecaprenol N-acetyl-beta-D-mannosaminyltransferase